MATNWQMLAMLPVSLLMREKRDEYVQYPPKKIRMRFFLNHLAADNISKYRHQKKLGVRLWDFVGFVEFWLLSGSYCRMASMLAAFFLPNKILGNEYYPGNVACIVPTPDKCMLFYNLFTFRKFLQVLTWDIAENMRDHLDCRLSC